MIITLDDFGLNKDVNNAVHRWTQTKKVDFISLLVNSRFTNEAIQIYKKDKKKQYTLGLHFNLVEGKPLCDKKEIPSLVGDSGYFYPLYLFIPRLFFGLIKREDIMKELHKQYRVFVDTHIECEHINSHQNIHVFHFIYICIEEFARNKHIKYIRQVSTVKNRLKKFPIKYFIFNILYFISSLLFWSYTYKSSSFFETTFHPGTTYDL